MPRPVAPEPTLDAELQIQDFKIAYYKTNDGKHNYAIVVLGVDGRLYTASSPRKPWTPHMMEIGEAPGPTNYRRGDEPDNF